MIGNDHFISREHLDIKTVCYVRKIINLALKLCQNGKKILTESRQKDAENHDADENNIIINKLRYRKLKNK